MKRRPSLFCPVVVALSVMAAAPGPAAAADCYSVGQRVAAENGGQLAKARPETRRGKTVCVVVVLIPAKDGQRPRRAEIVVPAG